VEKILRTKKDFFLKTSRVRPPNGGRNEANVVAVALAKTAANYFVILISM